MNGVQCAGHIYSLNQSEKRCHYFWQNNKLNSKIAAWNDKTLNKVSKIKNPNMIMHISSRSPWTGWACGDIDSTRHLSFLWSQTGCIVINYSILCSLMQTHEHTRSHTHTLGALCLRKRIVCWVELKWQGAELHTQHFAFRKGQCEISNVSLLVWYISAWFFHCWKNKYLFVLCCHPDEFIMLFSIKFSLIVS